MCTSLTFNDAFTVLSYVRLRFISRTTSRRQKCSSLSIHDITNSNNVLHFTAYKTSRLPLMHSAQDTAFLKLSSQITLLYYFIHTGFSWSSSGYCGDNLGGDYITLSQQCQWRLHYLCFTLPPVPGYGSLHTAFVHSGKKRATTLRLASTSMIFSIVLCSPKFKFSLFFFFKEFCYPAHAVCNSPWNKPTPCARPVGIQGK